MPNIDGDRLLRDLRALAKIGAYKTGVHRPTYSPEDVESRHWLAARMTEAGLDPEIDGIGNVIGRARGDGPQLLLGSHLETQPHAGWLDGALGVIYGLEVARTLGGGIDVAAWADEEGHFGSFIGSRSFCGLLPEAEIDACRNRERHDVARGAATGRLRRSAARRWSIRRAIAATSRRISSRAPNWRIPASASASSPPSSAAIASASCSRACRTTPAPRAWRSARMPASRWCSWRAAIYQRFPEVAGPRTVWTTGRITLDPGAPSIVPGRAEMLFQFRDTDPALLATLERELEALVAEATRGPCTVTIAERGQSVPQAMDAGFQDALERAAERHAPGLHVRMPSGAGHDAQILAERMQSAMLFVPSIGGISHHYAENTKDEDIVLGCQVFADAAAEILAG